MSIISQLYSFLFEKTEKLAPLQPSSLSHALYDFVEHGGQKLGKSLCVLSTSAMQSGPEVGTQEEALLTHSGLDPLLRRLALHFLLLVYISFCPCRDGIFSTNAGCEGLGWKEKRRGECWKSPYNTGGAYHSPCWTPMHSDDEPDLGLREQTGTYSFSCLVNFTT